MTETPPSVAIEPARASFLGRASIVWLIPILALLISLGVAFQAYNNRGPLIEIEFVSGAGIAKGQTELRYRDVAVGLVEDVKFSPELSAVIAYVRVNKDVAPYIDVASTFWVVQPEITAQGVTGLDTVLSGVYIEGTWDSDIGPQETRFTAAVDPPIVGSGSPGLEIVLRTTPAASLQDNSPIIFRGVEVGRIGKANISPGGSFAIADGVIYEPFVRLISPSTRFWDTSGFSFKLDQSGAEIDFSSLATLLGGGLTFDTFVSGAGPVEQGAVFDVYLDESSARNSLFNQSDVADLEVRVVFDENISGLAVGAPVELSGLPIGSVENISGVVDAGTFNDNRVRLSALLDIQPARLGLPGEVTAEAALEFLAVRIEEGLRVRLASSGLLGGGLKIELVQVDDAAPVVFQTTDGVIPILPTTESSVSDASATLEGVVNRFQALPIEELLNAGVIFLNNAATLVASEDLQETPGDVRALLSDVRGMVNSDDIQNIPVALNAAIVRFETLLAELEEQQLATRLSAALDAAAAASGNVSASFEGFPALVEQFGAVARMVETVPLDALTTQLTELVASVDEIVGTDAARELPADLSAALNEINATLADVREGGAIDNVNATLLSARNAADAIATSTQDFPAVVAEMQSVLLAARRTIAGFNNGEALSREVQRALRDISSAAEALAALARTLERDPSALIRGR
ncbi:MlaD family protein [Rhodobacteraceae bacterium]|nr:MlaD family protein [Paracoccaceae bacterium]